MCIRDRDEDIDIVPFNQTYISELEPLDTLFDTKEGKDLSYYYSQMCIRDSHRTQQAQK